MFKNLLLVCTAALMLISCGSKSKSALKYNQDIIGKERELIPDISSTESSVKAFFTNGMYDSVGQAGARMEGLIEKKISEIKALPMPDAKGVDKFKNAVLEYFGFMKNAYSKYRELGEVKTEEERQAIVNDVREVYSKRKEIVEEFRNAQRKYAADNGFRLESPPPGE